MRLRIPVRQAKEWVSVLPGSDRSRKLIIRENGDELEVPIDDLAPLEPQITRALEDDSPSHSPAA
jgi:hypothetical protein